MDRHGTDMFRMFPIQFFAVLTTKLGSAIPKLGNAYSPAALQTRKFSYGRRIDRSFYPIIIDTMMVCIPPARIAAISLGTTSRCKFFAANSTFHKTFMFLSPVIRRTIYTDRKRSEIKACQKGQYMPTLSSIISI